MKKLYHISLDFGKNDDLCFIPRIPASAADGEDKTIKRVCLSDSIEGCINLADLSNGDLKSHLFPIKSEKSSPIKVYEFHIDTDSILYPNQISKYVPDAEIFGEYWYTNPNGIRATKVYYIQIDKNFLVDEIKLSNGWIRPHFKNINYSICDIYPSLKQDGKQIFEFYLKKDLINNELNIDTIIFKIKFAMLMLQSDIANAMHLADYGETYKIESQFIENENKVIVSVNSSFFAITKNDILEKINEFI